MARNPIAPTAAGRGRLGKRITDRWQLYLLLILPLTWLVLFCYVPMSGLVLAFKKYNAGLGIWGSPWVGLQNFEKFFTSYKSGMVIRNTLTISLYSLLVSFPIPIIFALMLNVLPGKKYKKTIQTVTYIPYFFSTVIMVGLLFQLLDYRIGLYGALYTLFTGGTAPNILAIGTNFKHVYVWSGVWQATGYNAIIYIAALTATDMSLHEAAMTDAPSGDYLFAAAVAEFGMILSGSEYKGDSSYDSVLELLKQAPLSDEYREEFFSLVKIAQRNAALAE